MVLNGNYNDSGDGNGDGDLHDSSAIVVIRGEVVPATGRDVGNDGWVLFMFDWCHIRVFDI